MKSQRMHRKPHFSSHDGDSYWRWRAEGDSQAGGLLHVCVSTCLWVCGPLSCHAALFLLRATFSPSEGPKEDLFSNAKEIIRLFPQPCQCSDSIPKKTKIPWVLQTSHPMITHLPRWASKEYSRMQDDRRQLEAFFCLSRLLLVVSFLSCLPAPK